MRHLSLMRWQQQATQSLKMKVLYFISEWASSQVYLPQNWYCPSTKVLHISAYFQSLHSYVQLWLLCYVLWWLTTSTRFRPDYDDDFVSVSTFELTSVRVRTSSIFASTIIAAPFAVVRTPLQVPNLLPKCLTPYRPFRDLTISFVSFTFLRFERSNPSDFLSLGFECPDEKSP